MPAGTKGDTPTLVLECLRWNPEAAAAPAMASYTVPYDDGTSVMQALQYVKDALDGSLTFRWSCRMGICGSCGVMVNGRPRLACSTFLRDLGPGPVRVEPLAHFPVARDLAVDQNGFLDHLESVKPWLMEAPAAAPPPGQPHRLPPAAMQDWYGYAGCINCLLCYAACPQFGHDDRFTGPGALALLARWNGDPRDAGERHRAAILDAEEGVWSCTLVGYCSEVCPQGVDPAQAINRNKVGSLLGYLGLRRHGDGGDAP